MLRLTHRGFKVKRSQLHCDVDVSNRVTSGNRTELWLFAEMIFVTSGSHSTRSASEPTAIRPLRGYRLKILAALVLVTATNWFSSILPDTWKESELRVRTLIIIIQKARGAVSDIYVSVIVTVTVLTTVQTDVEHSARSCNVNSFHFF